MITIRAKSPGLWKVYESAGLHINRVAGVVTRRQAQHPMVTTFMDIAGNRHEIGSNPATWAATIRRILSGDGAPV